MVPLPGLDVHAGYGRINFKLVAEAGYRFVWCKSTEGNEPRKDDTSWVRNCAEASMNGMRAGVYHFPYPLPQDGTPGRHPLEQAERFHRRVGGLGSQEGELSPVIDAEWPPPHDWARWGCTGPQLSEWLREHCHAVSLLFGRTPVIYTYPDWWRRLIQSGADTSWASRYPLWFADYAWLGEGVPPVGWAPPHLSWVHATWDRWDVCQHSAEGSKVRVPGIPACPVDRDVIRTEAVLRRLCGYRSDSEPTQPEAVNTQPIVHPRVPLGRPALDGDDEPDGAA